MSQTPGHGFFRPTKIVSRDQQTLELRQFYPLPSHLDAAPFNYALDAYFFFSRSFGISAASWPREIFYRNTNILSRLHAHGLSLKILKDVTHPHNPATLLLHNIAELTAERTATGTSMTTLAQVFGAEISDAISHGSRHLLHLLRQPLKPRRRKLLWRAVNQLANDCLAVLSALRRLRVTAQAFVAIVPPSLLACLQFAEEYTAAMIDERLSHIALRLRKQPHLLDGSCLCIAMQMRLAAALEELNCRRFAMGYVRTNAGEYYAYRLSLLKKELQRSLYINTRALSTDPFYANSAAIVGSGLAATWATLAQTSQMSGMLGSNARNLIIASTLGIVIYVLKDRLKEWAKQRLTRRWVRWDHDISIDGDSLAAVGLGAFEGAAKERFCWENEGQLPAEVMALRQLHRTVPGASAELEQVFHYRRNLSLAPVAASPLPLGYGIEEMLRLNLDDILRRLDDPHQKVPHYRGGGRFRARSIPKVYHLNIVSVVRSNHDALSYTNRHRVVLNKERILRVERLVL